MPLHPRCSSRRALSQQGYSAHPGYSQCTVSSPVGHFLAPSYFYLLQCDTNFFAWESWSCVSRGAVQYGANVQPSTRRARYSYGWSSHESFDPERHLIEDRYWDEGRSEYMAANQVHWPIRRGQEIVSGDSSFSYSMTFLQKSQGFYRHNVRVYKSTLQDPPTRISEDRDFGTNDEVADDVVFLGHIALRTPVKIEDLPKFRNAQDKRFPFFEWHWDIRVSGRSVSMTATTSDGDKVGELNINNIMK